MIVHMTKRKTRGIHGVGSWRSEFRAADTKTLAIKRESEATAWRCSSGCRFDIREVIDQWNGFPVNPIPKRKNIRGSSGSLDCSIQVLGLIKAMYRRRWAGIKKRLERNG